MGPLTLAIALAAVSAAGCWIASLLTGDTSCAYQRSTSMLVPWFRR